MWCKGLAELEEGVCVCVCMCVCVCVQDFEKRKDEALDKKIKVPLL
jgi:hypothetical protein